MSKSLKRSNDLDWKPDSWKSFKASQQPIWPDNDSFQRVLEELSSLPPLVFAGEARNLTEQLAAVSRREAFLLQAGDSLILLSLSDATTFHNRATILSSHSHTTNPLRAFSS